MTESCTSTATNDTAPSPFRGKPGYRWARQLPAPVKRFLLSCFWPLKALVEGLQDYTAELVGHVPAHAPRMRWYRHICRIQVDTQSSIHRQCRMYRPYRIQIGEHSIINYGVLLDGRGGLAIGNNVSISEGTIILTLGHDVDDPDFALIGAPVTVKDHVFVGSYARILPGVTITEGAVVAADAVVTQDVASYTVVGGMPARHIRDRSRNLTYQLQHRKRFGQCPNANLRSAMQRQAPE